MAVSSILSAHPVRADEAYKVVTFGTSLTRHGGWQIPLSKDVQACLGKRVDVVDRSKAGATSSWGRQAIQSVVVEQPRVVITEFAVNDSSILKMVSKRRSVENLENIIKDIRKSGPDVKIYLLLSGEPWGLRRWIRPFFNGYVTEHRNVARRYGVEVIDTRSYWGTLTRKRYRSLVPDGLHPIARLTAAPVASVIAQTICADFSRAQYQSN